MKRIIALFLLLCTTLSFNTMVFAEGCDVQDDQRVSLEYIVQNWIDTQFQGDAEVSRIVTLKDTSDLCIGHLVSFEKDSLPAGYIVLSHKEIDNPIIEFAYEGQSIYEYLEEQVTGYNDTFDSPQPYSTNGEVSYSIAEENILYTDFINYSLNVKNGDDILLIDQNNLATILDITPNPNSEDTFWDDYYTFPPEGLGAHRYGDEINFDALDDGLKMSDMAPNEGNCGPTSITDVVRLYAKYELNDHSALPSLSLSSDKATYNRLVTYSGYASGAAVSMSKLISALKKHTKERGYSISVNDYLFDNWSDFTRDIQAKKPILLYTSSSKSAHSQVVVGYRVFTSGSQYLMIHSGWTTEASYVRYKPDSLTKFNGYCVSIS